MAITPVMRLWNSGPPTNGHHGVFTLGPIKCPTEFITDWTVSAMIDMHTVRHKTPVHERVLHGINYVIMSNQRVVLHIDCLWVWEYSEQLFRAQWKNKGVWSLKQFQAHYESFMQQLSTTWESFWCSPIQEGNVILNIRIDITPVLQIRCLSVDLYHRSYSHLSHQASLPSLLLSPEHDTVHYDDLKCSGSMRGTWRLLF